MRTTLASTSRHALSNPRALRPIASVAAGLLLLASAAQAQAQPQASTTSPNGVSELKPRPSTAQLDALRPDPEIFPVPENLEPNVAFWLEVYTGHDSDTVLLHDERYLQVVYAALDFGELMESELPETLKRKRRRDEIRKAKAKYGTLLQNLAAGRESSTHPRDQARVETLFATVPGDRSKYRSAVARLRTQTCLRDQFGEAVVRSGSYMPLIEEIFARHRLPEELTRLPFVESLFQWNARSSAAAGGIWQFMPSTARSYLEMDLEVDERFDPLHASDAAARLLADNYGALESWPLAITAYNHGRYGMQRAVKRLGTRDLGEIVKRYRSRTFGFASRNFYAELIAAYMAYEGRESYFPDHEPGDPVRYEEVTPSQFVAIRQLAEAAESEIDWLRELNPGMSREVWAGHIYWPRDYTLRVPEGQASAFSAAYEHLDARYKTAHQVGFRYRVRPGDTLSTIASHFGTSVSSVQRANALSSPHRIRIGQALLIPPARGGARVGTPVAVAADGEHRVRRGETLSRIARLYGTTTQALVATNGLSRPDRLAVGQKLKVPATGATQRTHVVRSGDTLAAIARRYGTSVQAIQRANRLRGHIIRPRQVLVIP